MSLPSVGSAGASVWLHPDVPVAVCSSLHSGHRQTHLFMRAVTWECTLTTGCIFKFLKTTISPSGIAKVENFNSRWMWDYLRHSLPACAGTLCWPAHFPACPWYHGEKSPPSGRWGTCTRHKTTIQCKIVAAVLHQESHDMSYYMWLIKAVWYIGNRWLM